MKLSENAHIEQFNLLMSVFPLPQFLELCSFTDLVVFAESGTDVNLQLLYHQFYRDNRVNLKGIFSKTPISLDNPLFPHFQKPYKSKSLDFGCIKNNTLFLDLTTTTKNEEISAKVLQQEGTYWILGKTLIRYYSIHAAVIQPFSHFANKHPNVPIFLYERPIFPPQGHRTDFENKLVENNVTIVNINKSLRAIPYLTADYELFDYTKEEIIALTEAATSFIDSNGARKFQDFSVGRVNYKNGNRVTAYQPDDYERRCFIVGGCVGIIAQIDEHTTASWLQKSFNQAGKKIKVENYHYCVRGMYENLVDILCNLPVKDNDIVIFETSLPGWREPRVYDKIVLPTGKLFSKQPHKYGEVFYDCDGAGHYNANGAHELADELFTHIKKNNYFEGANNFELYKKLIPENIRPMNQYGAPKNHNQNKTGFGHDAELSKYKAELSRIREKNIGTIGSIVMNCNPFTLGHRYLIEHAASQVKHLFVFAVEEDKSVFPFKDRFELMKLGTADLKNVTILPSGKFIISSLTFADYFNKGQLQDRAIDPSQDLELFAKEIAPVLGITVRFVGEEPLDKVTRQYNNAMQKILPKYGITLEVIRRKESGGMVISASRVRKLLETKNFDEIAKLVPKTTLEYLGKNFPNGLKHTSSGV